MDTQDREVLIAITELKTQVIHLNEKIDRITGQSDTIIATEASAASAHKRIDKMESSQQWLSRSFIGAIILFIVDKLFI